VDKAIVARSNCQNHRRTKAELQAFEVAIVEFVGFVAINGLPGVDWGETLAYISSLQSGAAFGSVGAGAIMRDR
jgi:hypothetical protein